MVSVYTKQRYDAVGSLLIKSVSEICGDAGDSSLPDYVLVKRLDDLLRAVILGISSIVVHVGIKQRFCRQAG